MASPARSPPPEAETEEDNDDESENNDDDVSSRQGGDAPEEPPVQNFHDMLDAQLNSDSDAEDGSQHRPSMATNPSQAAPSSPRPFWKDSLLRGRAPHLSAGDGSPPHDQTTPNEAAVPGVSPVAGRSISGETDTDASPVRQEASPGGAGRASPSPMAGGSDIPRQNISHLLPASPSGSARCMGVAPASSDISVPPQNAIEMPSPVSDAETRRNTEEDQLDATEASDEAHADAILEAHTNPSPDAKRARPAQGAPQVAKQELQWGSDDDSVEERPKKACRGRPRKAKPEAKVQPQPEQAGASSKKAKRSAAATSTARQSSAKKAKLSRAKAAQPEEPVSAEQGSCAAEASLDDVAAIADGEAAEPELEAETSAQKGSKRKRLTKKTGKQEPEMRVKEEAHSSLPRNAVASAAAVKQEFQQPVAETQPVRVRPRVKVEQPSGPVPSTLEVASAALACMDSQWGLPQEVQVKSEKRSTAAKSRAKAAKRKPSAVHAVAALSPVQDGAAEVCNNDHSKSSSSSKAPRLAEESGTPSRRPKEEAASPYSAESASPSAGEAPRNTESVCFTATGLVLGAKHRRQLRSRLGVQFVDEWIPECTHLITDTFRRTTKMMCAICAGARIVTPDFVDACLKAGCIVDDAPFALNDAVCEAAFAKKHGLPRYSLQAALEEARRSGPLLTGVAVHCSPVVAGRAEMKTLVEAAGAQWLRHLPGPMEPADSEPVLLLGKAGAEPPPRHADRWRLHTAYDAELLREAACTQKLRYDMYRI